MSDSRPSARHKDPRVQAALEDYLDRVDSGEIVDRAAFLAEHSDIAEELRSFIETAEELQRIGETHQKQGDLQASAASTHSVARREAETAAPRKADKSDRSGDLPSPFGRYEIVKPLGSGAMGTVYLARDTQLQRDIALKTPSFDEDESGELLERFYREARSAATLRHANICAVFDVGEIDGQHFISMAYIQGRPLSAYIDPDRPQSEKQILLMIRKLALALQEAHDHDVIHRDLKPGNIMVDPKGEPIIMDFGLACQVPKEGEARLTQSGMLVGSPAYMSPEQVQGDPDKLVPASDQYALGVILYELLTGELPFRGGITAVIGQILTREPTPPGELRTDLDPRIEALCRKMMSKDVGDRFATVKDVAVEAARILKSPGPKSPSSRSVVTTRRPNVDRTTQSAESSQIQKTQHAVPEPEIEVASASQTLRSRRQPPRRSARRKGRRSAAPGWIRWVTIAVGVLLSGVTLWSLTFFFRSGDALVRVEINDPDIRFSLQGQTLTFEDDGQEIQLEPQADNVLEVTYGGATFRTEESFELIKGDNPAVSVTILDEKLLAEFGETLLGEWSVVETAMDQDEPLAGVVGSSTGSTGNADIRPTNSGRTVASDDGWIDVVSLIDPERDKYDFSWTGANNWVVRNEELILRPDGNAAKLLFPLVLDGASLEWEISFTRTSGEKQFTTDIPAISGGVSVSLGWGTDQVLMGSDPSHQENISLGPCVFRNRQRMTVRIRVERENGRDQVEVFVDGESIGEWTGDRETIASVLQDSQVYRTDQRTGLYVGPRTAYTFHSIRLRMLEGEARLLDGTVASTGASGGPSESADGWISLFNGRDLTGWTPVASAGEWRVENGVLTATPGNTGWLATQQEFADFELELDYKLAARGNSGIFLRMPANAGGNGAGFLEIQLFDDASRRVQDWQRNGSVYAVQGPPPSASVPAGQWHRMNILAVGPEITVSINGSEINRVTLSGATVQGDPKPHLHSHRGHIGLQRHGSEVEFRNIRIRELEARPSVSTGAPELVSLTELNTPGWDSFAWVSPDGLRIYWEGPAPDGDGPNWIWTAARPQVGAGFEDPEALLEGRHPTLTPDELEIVFMKQPGRGQRSLFKASRLSADGVFEQPRPVLQFRSFRVNSPSISGNGDVLTVNAFPAGGELQYLVAQRAPNNNWGQPTPLNLDWDDAQRGGPLTWISVSEDGLSILATQEGDSGKKRVLYCRRTDVADAFRDWQYLSLPGIGQIYGRAPRYLPATRELFLTAPPDYALSSQDSGWLAGNESDLWVIRNVDLD